ncbi:uncharacterized protein LOC117117981 [Anneissia japonica]|uniref:uncharacterized protein LOC117117981 n=1 Tax=Anneissia japonica TaxID=1529436 RepID=UPI0014258B69|nr:uncharacterized protein LOC117117981 [Anneissia japonica]
MELIKTTRGGYKLCFEGYTYTKVKENRITKHWKCSGRHKYNCLVTIKTDVNVSRILNEKKYDDAHTHCPDYVAIEALKVRNSIKEDSRTNRPSVMAPPLARG